MVMIRLVSVKVKVRVRRNQSQGEDENQGDDKSTEFRDGGGKSIKGPKSLDGCTLEEGRISEDSLNWLSSSFLSGVATLETFRQDQLTMSISLLPSSVLLFHGEAHSAKSVLYAEDTVRWRLT